MGARGGPGNPLTVGVGVGYTVTGGAGWGPGTLSRWVWGVDCHRRRQQGSSWQQEEAQVREESPSLVLTGDRGQRRGQGSPHSSLGPWGPVHLLPIVSFYLFWQQAHSQRLLHPAHQTGQSRLFKVRG